jgi:hypothetical protein
MEVKPRLDGMPADRISNDLHLASFLRAISRKFLMSWTCLGCEIGGEGIRDVSIDKRYIVMEYH